MDTSRKICTVLTPDDLSAGNIKTTIKTIEHNADKFYLLQADWQMNLWEVVEQLGKFSNDENTLTRMRIAYDLKFNLETTLQEDDTLSNVKPIKTFADLLELMEFDENLNLKMKFDEELKRSRPYFHVVINDDGITPKEGTDEASRAVAKLFQQTVFLNVVGLDIQKKSEIKKASIKRIFREKYSKLREEILSNKKFIESKLSDGTKLSSESRERASKIITAFDAMLAEFDKAKKRNIRIAAMGTKKAGKSVVINSLLKHDYAPTSSTLPTPNTIKYIPVPKYLNKPLTLDYAGKTYTFADDKAIYEFIEDEFKRAQKITGKGAGLPDMTIYYPCDELNGYEVWDTPGPNVAFTDEHQKNAEACIKEVDVCIFVMNYSNHLTNDEVTFLKNIHSFFKDNNKFYSLFITVNRIDERYAVNEEKSVDRILDYISTRLEDLTPPYKNIVIFGTSALQSFYLDKVVELAQAEGMTPIDYDAIRKLKKTYRDAMTPLNFIGGEFTHLEDFHGIETATEKELYALSGVPQLRAYTQYIGESKADTEIVNNIVVICETVFNQINNDLLVTLLTDLSKGNEKDKKALIEFAALINGLKRYVDSAITDVRGKIEAYNVGEALLEVDKLLKDMRRRAKQRAVERGRGMLDNASFTPDDVKEAMTNRTVKSQRMREFDNQIARMVIAVNADSVNNLGNIQKANCDKYIVGVENTIRGAQEKISKQTEVVKAKVIETIPNAAAQNIISNFKTPNFPPAIDRLNAQAKQMNTALDAAIIAEAAEDAKRIEYETFYRTEYYTTYEKKTREREASGIWENIRSFFGKTYYEDYIEEVPGERQVEDKRAVEVYDVEKFKRIIARQLQDRITAAVDSTHDSMDADVKENIRKIFADVKAQGNKICDLYNRIYADFDRDVKMATDKTDTHRKALERDIGTFTEIKTKLQTFIDDWNNILYVGAKE